MFENGIRETTQLTRREMLGKLGTGVLAALSGAIPHDLSASAFGDDLPSVESSVEDDLLRENGWPVKKDLPVTGFFHPFFEPVREMILKDMSDHQVPSASFALICNGQFYVLAGIGYANRKCTKLVTPKTMFRVASIEKQIVTTAIPVLLDELGLTTEDKPFQILYEQGIRPPKGMQMGK